MKKKDIIEECRQGVPDGSLRTARPGKNLIGLPQRLERPLDDIEGGGAHGKRLQRITAGPDIWLGHEPGKMRTPFLRPTDKPFLQSLPPPNGIGGREVVGL